MASHILGLLPGWSEEAGPVPWRFVTPITAQYAEQPAFLVGELACLALGLLTLWHAKAHGGRHMLTWMGALVGGAVNDALIRMIPVADNFWHSQATLNLTARMPLYVLAVYASFLYIGTVASWSTRLPPLAACVASALISAARKQLAAEAGVRASSALNKERVRNATALLRETGVWEV